MKNLHLAALHFLCFLVGFVIVSQKMQESMHNKMGEVMVERLAFFNRFALHGFASDDDIAQHRPGLRSGLDRKGRKRQHIGWLVLAAPFGIQRLNGRIVGKDDAQLTVGIFEAKIDPCRFDRLSDKSFECCFIGPIAGFDGYIDMDRVV